MKIAVPVADNAHTIYTRIGRAPYFAIFEDGRFTEMRINQHAASHHDEDEEAQHHHEAGHGHGKGSGKRKGDLHAHDDEALLPMEAYSKEEVEHHRKDLGNLSDIDIILTRAIGPNMKEALELAGMKVVKIRKKEGDTAEEAVQNFLAKEHS
ncbi:MAG TPA: hypothetical protein ENK93_02215 [Campylobacteraceae bacterium]|nr:hypothetical protein [Campylobacteraceae bacterium]